MILRIIYKVCSLLILKRIGHQLDIEQAPDQAGFRSNFSCDDNLFVMRMLIERCGEWRSPLCIASLDLRKAFDTVSHLAVKEALTAQGISEEYVELILRLYTD